MGTLKVLLNGGYAPTISTLGSAGYDLRSPIDCIIPPNSDMLIKLGFSMELTFSYYAQIWPRSGLDTKHRITTGAGIIDNDYRGEVGVLMRNLSDKPYNIAKGDRIAQMIIMRYESPMIDVVSSLESTNRGEGGFGSTGK
jgi:dUTP pyrophosphatase